METEIEREKIEIKLKLIFLLSHEKVSTVLQFVKSYFCLLEAYKILYIQELLYV